MNWKYIFAVYMSHVRDHEGTDFLYLASDIEQLIKDCELDTQQAKELRDYITEQHSV